MNKNKTSLEWIEDLALRLATIAHDTETWESYKIVETDTRGIVIDRTENNLSHYVRECEKHFSALYDADYQQDIENAKLEKQVNDIVEAMKSVIGGARRSQQQGQILIAMQIEQALQQLGINTDD